MPELHQIVERAHESLLLGPLEKHDIERGDIILYRGVLLIIDVCVEHAPPMVRVPGTRLSFPLNQKRYVRVGAMPRCGECDGTGEIECAPSSETGHAEVVTCDVCDGGGYLE